MVTKTIKACWWWWRTSLRSTEYELVVSNGIAKPVVGTAITGTQRAETEGQWLKDLKGKNYLFQAINCSILYKIVIKKGVCQIQDSKKGLIAQFNMTTNRMFPLNIHNTTTMCFVAKLKDIAWLWHFHYRRINFGRLKMLQ